MNQSLNPSVRLNKSSLSLMKSLGNGNTVDSF